MKKRNKFHPIKTEYSKAMQVFSKNLRTILRERGISQEDLATYVDISVYTVKKYLGKNPPVMALDVAVRIAEALGVSLTRMCQETEGDSITEDADVPMTQMCQEPEGASLMEDAGVPVTGCVYHKGNKVIFVLDSPKQFEGRFDDTLVCRKAA